MHLEALLSAAFALGLPTWLLVEQLVHSLGRMAPPGPAGAAGRTALRALRRAA